MKKKKPLLFLQVVGVMFLTGIDAGVIFTLRGSSRIGMKTLV
jgi:hypothetical protein